MPRSKRKTLQVKTAILVDPMGSDLGFTCIQRRDYLMLRYKTPYTDELTVREATDAIADLIERKET